PIQIQSHKGRIYDFPVLKDRITIGRSIENDLVLTDHTVSRHHVEITRTKEGFQLSDLGSYNGTIVNKFPVQSTLLKHEDQIKIGLTKLTFFIRGKEELSLVDSLILIPETDDEKESQRIINSSPQQDHFDSKELLVSLEASKKLPESDLNTPSAAIDEQLKVSADLSSLERSNKVLFVLYEISRQLNSIQDFHELLSKIMDLIFMVIDADYGFLILIGEEGQDELIPVVVKCRDDQVDDKEEFKASRSIINKVITDKLALLTSNAMADTRLDHGKSLFIHQIRSAMCIPLLKKDKIIGVIQLDSVRLDNQFTNDDLELLKAIGSQMAMIIEQASLNEQIREEERMRNRLERFHSPQIIEMILKGGQETKDNIMEPKDLTATVLFTDIIGFTSISEQMPPRKINILLNQYFSRMTDIVFEYDGTLDKYIGDGLMAVFGAPMEKRDDAERAIRAALKMRKYLAHIGGKSLTKGEIKVRIGINTGRVVAGNIGSPRRMDYTVIGDPVNTASRLESIARPNQILIGEETYRRVKGKFTINRVGPKRVKGKSMEINVYEVTD
ncbi:adenylate/guanylate cyclase domain-containing protein, partial [Thermodesulfobacteriota bacterium]